MKTASLGSVSSGTMLETDLIPAFVSVLEALAEGTEHAALIREANEWRALDAGEGFDGAEDYDAPDTMEGLLSDLFDALQEAAPAYAYFGAHEGDGADYGFWLYPDFQDMFREDGGLEVTDTSEVPADYVGEVLHVNDHGNATLYVANKGELTEIWGAV